MNQTLLAKRKKLEEQIATAVQNTEIKLSDRAYPGVVIRLGDHQRKLTEEVKSPRFHISDERLVDR